MYFLLSVDVLSLIKQTDIRRGFFSPGIPEAHGDSRLLLDLTFNLILTLNLRYTDVEATFVRVYSVSLLDSHHYLLEA